MTPTTIQMVAAALFALAILHTFSTKFFERLAHQQPKHAGIWHLLGEIEAVFGFWALILVICMFALEGSKTAIEYVDTRNFTEPLFVFAIMVVAGTKPILQFAMKILTGVAKIIPLPGATGFYFVVMFLTPILGSFITEPAAMTLAAIILSKHIFSKGASQLLKYGTLGALFVNVSIGGTLTHFAAPPVLMVASKWQWDTLYMLTHFGWKAAIAVLINASFVTFLLRSELAKIPFGKESRMVMTTPFSLVLVHITFLVGIVVFAHHPAIFMGLFLFFMGIASAYYQHQDRLILREALLVAFFLAGLVVLGGLQQWWLQPLLLSMNSDAIYYGATALTAITDNAALTYLGSLVEGLSEEFKYALVSGAVTGGGLTIIANAPNPAGASILKGHFEDDTINPLYLLLSALGPTIVAIIAFRFL